MIENIEVELDSQVTSMDYNDATNKPKLNGIELIGNKTNSELGIPTKTSDLQNDSGFINNETDPVFSSSPSASITNNDISNWNNKSNFSGSYDDLTNKPSIPSNTSDLQNDSGFINKNVNDLTYYTLSTNTGSKIELSINSSTFVMTLNLKDKDNNIISTGSVDLPLESAVVNGSYDSTNKKIVLTLENGNTIDIPVGDLVNGLQTEITSNNKLSSDLVDDTNNTNKFVTTSEKNTWNSKSDFSGSYNDLSNKPTIPVVPTNVSAFVNDAEYLTQHQDISGKEDKTNKVTSMSVSSTDTEYPSAKCVYDALQNVGGNVDMAQYIIKTNSTSDVFVFEGKKAGIYTFNTIYDTLYFYYKIKNSDSTYKTAGYGQLLEICLYEDFDYDNAETNYTFGYCYFKDVNSGVVTRKYIKKDYNFIQTGGSGYCTLLTGENQTFYGTKTFATIPRQNNTTAPTQDTEFTNKKYVDDSISASLGDVETLLGGI